MNRCMVCEKHSNLAAYTGPAIGDLGGWLMTHFPVLDGVPATKGHLLIETQRHVTSFADLNDEESLSLGILIRDGTSWIQSNFSDVEHVYAFRINDKVPHLHMHLIPRYPGTPKEFWGGRILDFASAPKIGLAEIQHICSFDEVLDIGE